MSDLETCAFCPEPAPTTYCDIPICGDSHCMVEAYEASRYDAAEDVVTGMREAS